MNKEILISNINKIHTTEMGINRIKKNLKFEINDVVEFCIRKILDDYQMLIQSMYLTKYIAEKTNKDLSNVRYSPIVKKLYKYNGEI